ncbi:MAG: hypothetical protein NTU44_17320 [Bacteroidetes bacterium]|nr:hypothetical protein [Bacteroidota bacterium]
MKNIILIFSLFIFSNLPVSGQYFNETKRDYQWIGGDGPTSPPYHGGCGINFNDIPFSTDTCTLPSLMLRGDVGAISDWKGDLLFYTNGRVVIDRTNNIMPNGQGLSIGQIYYDYYLYYPIYQGIIILPEPESNSLYVIFHQKIEYINGSGLTVTGLYYSLVDMTLNNGLGDVTEKNVPLIEDTLNEGFMTAARHANGRDWWMLTGELNRPYFYRLLLQPSGISVVGKQVVEKASWHAVLGLASFSPDGQYYAQCGFWDSLRVDLYRFDRCSGLLSDYVDLGFPLPAGDNGGTLSFSPNSRFLYYCSAMNMYQFDLQANDILNSRQLVGTWDGTMWGAMNTCFDHMQLAPDSTIFLSTSGTPYLHVIEHPDSLGTACGFVQRKITTPHVFYEFPNYPHFRLGRLEGSACDTIYHTGIEETSSSEPMPLTVFPNPCSDWIQIDVGKRSNAQPRILVIYNMLSEISAEINVVPFQGMVKYDVRQFAEGMYSCVLKTDKKVLSTGKFIIFR